MNTPVQPHLQGAVQSCQLRRDNLKVIWAILCERAVVDRETNNISLFNVVEEVAVPAQPPVSLKELGLPHGVVPVVFRLVVLWSRSDQGVPEKGRGRVRVGMPTETIAFGGEFDVDLMEFLRSRAMINLPGLPIGGGDGIYRFLIDGKTNSEDWTQMFELPLRVTFQHQDAARFLTP
jgi:hypothetical protein